ncbi:MAG: O-antigen polymerase [Halothece sp.]
MTISNLYPDNAFPRREVFIPTPTQAGTISLLAGIVFAFLTINPNDLPSDMARQVAYFVGGGFIASLWFDSTRGWSNLFRTDLVCLSGLYFFTLLEFLYPQEDFNSKLTSEQTVAALHVLLIAIAALTIGRHFSLLKPVPKKWLNFQDIPDQTLFRIFLISAFLGYYYMLSTVDFDILQAMDEMQKARFRQSWSRGQMGGTEVFLSELKLLRYAIPPIGGILINRRQTMRWWQIILVGLVLYFAFYQAFMGGTRNTFGSYLAGFLAGYILSLERVKLWKILLPVGISGYIMLFITRHMLRFRTMGFRNYMESGGFEAVEADEGLAIDYNLWPIGKIVDSMPDTYNFLGWEMINVFATKPVPRVLWPDKPFGLSVEISDIVGTTQMTVAATYVGEAYMLGGIIAVIVISLIIGAASNWWTRIISQQSSGYAIVVGALGFFVAAMTMRSLVFFTTIILPIIALIFFAKFVPALIGAQKKRKAEG